MSIYTRREEIAVMRNVGASNWFIKAPMMLEGMLIGFFWFYHTCRINDIWISIFISGVPWCIFKRYVSITGGISYDNSDIFDIDRHRYGRWTCGKFFIHNKISTLETLGGLLYEKKCHDFMCSVGDDIITIIPITGGKL